MTEQPDLLSWEPRRFHGETYLPERDEARLTSQLHRVFEVMRDGEWQSLREIASAAEAPEASTSARLRDLRRPENGGFTIERRHRLAGIWEYRLIPNSGGGE